MRGEARGRDGGSGSRQVAPVDAGLGVGDLVEAGHPEPVGAPTLPLVHEVPDGQDNLQHLLQTPAADQLPGGQQDGCGGRGRTVQIPTDGARAAGPLAPQHGATTKSRKGLQVSCTLGGAGTMPTPPQTSYPTPAHLQGRHQLAKCQFAK